MQVAAGDTIAVAGLLVGAGPAMLDGVRFEGTCPSDARLSFPNIFVEAGGATFGNVTLSAASVATDGPLELSSVVASPMVLRATNELRLDDVALTTDSLEVLAARATIVDSSIDGPVRLEAAEASRLDDVVVHDENATGVALEVVTTASITMSSVFVRSARAKGVSIRTSTITLSSFAVRGPSVIGLEMDDSTVTARHVSVADTTSPAVFANRSYVAFHDVFVDRLRPTGAPTEPDRLAVVLESSTGTFSAVVTAPNAPAISSHGGDIELTDFLVLGDGTLGTRGGAIRTHGGILRLERGRIDGPSDRGVLATDGGRLEIRDLAVQRVRMQTGDVSEASGVDVVNGSTLTAERLEIRDVNGAGLAVRDDSSSAIVTDLTVRAVSYEDTFASGMCVFAREGTSLSILRANLEDCDRTGIGAGGTLTVEHATIVVPTLRAGIFLAAGNQDRPPTNITDVDISHDEAEAPAYGTETIEYVGISARVRRLSATRLRIRGSSDAAIHLADSEASFDQVEITSPRGAAIVARSQSTVTFANTRIAGPAASVFGAAVLVRGSDFTMSDFEILDGAEPALAVESSLEGDPSVELSRGRIAGNQGGIVAFESNKDSVSMEDVFFVDSGQPLTTRD